MGLLFVADDGRAFGDMGLETFLHPFRRGFSVAADYCDRILVDVDGDRYAELLLGEPALARLAVAVRQVGIAHIGPVDPYTVPQNDAILVAVDGSEHAVPPFPRRLMRDSAYLGSCIQGHVEPHENREADPCRKLLSAVFQYGSGQRVEACAARPTPVA